MVYKTLLSNRYRQWVLAYDTLSESDEAAIRHAITQLSTPPRISIIITQDGDLEYREEALASARGQLYPACEVIIARTMAEAWQQVSGDYVAFLGSQDRLAPHALFMMATALVHFPHLDIIYSDEDCLDTENKRHTPWFKGNWT